MVFQNDILAGASGSIPTYQIDQSIRFNDGDGSDLVKTLGTGDQKTWTYSLWFKRGELGTGNFLLEANGGSGGNQRGMIYFQTTDKINVTIGDPSNANNYDYLTDAVFRDPSAWYHIVFVLDTTRSNVYNDTPGTNRIEIYVNGEFQTLSQPYSALPLNYASGRFNAALSHAVNGNVYSGTAANFDGYCAEIHFIDGQGLAPTAFGEYNNDGVWVPIEYVGTYGSPNGFYITGEDSADLGADYSGNGNDFTSTGLTSDDQVADTPTNNFPTFSPINLDGVTLADGNLKCNSAGYWSGAAATMSLPTTGKWYIETLVGNRYGSYMAQGFVPNDGSLITYAAQAINYGSKDSTYTPNYGLGMAGNGDTFGFYAATGTTTATVTEPDGSTLQSTGEIYMCHAIDLDNERYFVGTAFVGDGSVTWFGHAGIGADPEIPSEGLDISAYLATYGDYGLTFFHAPNATSGNPYATVDFGQSGFTYTPPTGFSALSTANLPTPTIADGSTAFQTTLYTGNGTAIGSGGLAVSQSENSTFQPDFVWIKKRSGVIEHVLTDAVRGVTKELSSNDTGAEETVTEGLTTFGSAGFTVGSDGSYNTSSATYAGWQWLAGNGTASNEDGSINTIATSVNTTAGISISTYTGNATSGATIGHGLGVAPDVIIVKNMDAADAWQVYHSGVASDPATDYLVLNSIAPKVDNVNRWNDTAPTSSVFSLGNAVEVNTNTEDYVAYCFAGVEGFSKFGSYTGNGSTNGPFVWCGFRPAWVLIKRAVGGNENWQLQDSTRNPYNVIDDAIYVDSAAAEVTNNSAFYTDFLSNGFKVRASHAGRNASGGIYTYMAFAENPFGGDGVAPATAR